ncbi:flagellar biosynthesis protein FlgN [Lutimaribacter marinistellae]|uniref:Flagellar biosynthesis protein FlgN n=1 Tax=Lutimaribacter marinistellae TaxID=1820329 RepID=A0ABV7TB47_9RHOB
MTDEKTDETVAALDALLEREKAALLAGDLSGLDGLTSEKEALILRINELGNLARGQVEALERKVGRNRDLIESAREGIRAVADRMAELRRIRQGLETYDRSGQKHRHPVRARAELEKRA